MTQQLSYLPQRSSMLEHRCGQRVSEYMSTSVRRVYPSVGQGTLD
jgi:hypothetical protein